MHAAVRLAKGEATALELRAGMDFRKAHVAGARWSNRQRERELAAFRLPTHDGVAETTGDAKRPMPAERGQ